MRTPSNEAPKLGSNASRTLIDWPPSASNRINSDLRSHRAGLGTSGAGRSCAFARAAALQHRRPTALRYLIGDPIRFVSSGSSTGPTRSEAWKTTEDAPAERNLDGRRCRLRWVADGPLESLLSQQNGRTRFTGSSSLNHRCQLGLNGPVVHISRRAPCERDSVGLTSASRRRRS